MSERQRRAKLEAACMAIDFTLTERQRRLQLECREFAKDVLAGAHEISEARPTSEERFVATKPAYEAMVAAGFLRKLIPAQAGGESAGLIDIAIMAEELYGVNASISLTMLGTVIGLLPIVSGGTSEQRDRLLAPFLLRSGAPLAAYCSSEPGGSANAASPPPGEGVRTTAKRHADAWIINGRKTWISSATGWDRKGADVLCVVCRTAAEAPPDQAISIIAVERATPGIVLERPIEALGHRSHFTPQLAFENVSAPTHNLLGQEGRGLALAAASLTGSAALVGIFGVALMREAFAFALQFARTERRGGIDPIIEHQAVGYALADAKTAIEAARYLSWRACHAVDSGSPVGDELAIQAKVHGSETAVRVITQLMSVVGIDSYDLQLPLGRLLQEALALPIYFGGNVGIRRRQLHAMLMRKDYEPLIASGAA